MDGDFKRMLNQLADMAVEHPCRSINTIYFKYEENKKQVYVKEKGKDLQGMTFEK
ncbi:MAG: hypothetical protein ACQER9_01675 [Nanobdellota archaeon]